MPLASGSRLGPYRIDAEIGAGGMGHVFRATDTRLDRAVAIKVLPQHRWSDPQLRLRFEREARSLSSLSHPNLCALYDVGELTQSGASVPYLVMELLQGETLRDRLESGRIGVRKALSFAAQIASGLAAAHAKGVIHRDLKPENVFITEGELLKILDFGLAVSTLNSDESTTAVRTEPGMVMGTAHYMSPEQVRGSTLDARSDIFCLGIVLFEMLSGRVPFHARSQVETMNAILVDEVPELPGVPEAVDALVRRCLEKDPAQRFSSARDLAFALDSAAKSVTTSTPTPARSPVHARSAESRAESRSSKARIAILALIGAAIVATAVLSRDNAPEAEPPRLRTLTWSGRDSYPAASPDGRLIAYVSSRDGSRRIWLKQLADGTEAPVTSGPDDSRPRFNHNGTAILFTRRAEGMSALYRVGIVGGEPRKLIDNAFDGDWSPDGTRLAFIRHRPTADRASTVCTAPVDGGAVTEIFASSMEDFISPRWSPDSTRLAVTRGPRTTSSGSVLVIDLVSGDKRVLAREGTHGQVSGVTWTPKGDALLYIELDALEGAGLPRRQGSSALVRQEVDSGRARVLLRTPHTAADTIAIAGNGVVFTEDVTRQSLQEVSIDGSGTPRWLSRGMSVDRQPVYTRDGRGVIFASDRGDNVDLWQLTLASGSLRRLTDHNAIDWDPHAAPDGKSLFWSSARGGHFEIWTASVDGASPHQVTRDGVDAENPSISTADDWVYYDSSNPKSDGLWRVPRNGGTAQLMVPGETLHPVVSADGTLIVYQRPQSSGASNIEVVRAADRKIFTVASGVGIFALRAQWIGSTHTIAFRAPDANGRITLFAQDVQPGVDTGGTRRPLLAAGNSDVEAETFAISPDGTRVVLSAIDEASGLMIADGVAGID